MQLQVEVIEHTNSMSGHNVLVIGGCGFVGFHIVKALLDDSTWSSVHVMSRNPSSNQVEGAQYHSGNVTSTDQVLSVLAVVRPSVIIYAAAPLATGAAHGNSHFNTTVKGVHNVLDAAISSQYVKAFVYTSSTTVLDLSPHDCVKEDAPLLSASSRADHYSKSKAIADKTVQESNGKGGLRTVCLRPCLIYGERDKQCITESLRVLQQKRQRYQIGDNTSLYDFVSAQNVAQAHLLAAKAILSSRDEERAKVDGEAFFITDGDPLPFWSFHRKIWAAAGDRTASKDVIIVPAWFILNLATVVEWIYWFFTMGLKTPRTFNRHFLIHSCQPFTYSIQKARERLGYVPSGSRDEHIQKGVNWELRQEREVDRKI